MDIIIKRFTDFDIKELYQLLQLRTEVFVVEQNCVYQDMDGKDHKAIHILGYVNDQLASYTRIFKPGDYFDRSSIGRVVVSPLYRGKSYGKEIMKASIAFIKAENYSSVKISAQCYLDKFYTNLGFIATGEKYLEDGIPHQAMLMEL